MTSLAAHEQAATLPENPIFHRDVSGGNILIYPSVRMMEDGGRMLKWVGYLTDWELSKPINAREVSSKPERTVCVNCLFCFWI